MTKSDCTPPKSISMISEEVFKDFYRQTAVPLRRYVIHTMGAARHADDIVQETYLRLLRHPPQTENPQELRPYAFRIASNLITDSWRKQKHETGVPETLDASTVDSDAALPLDMKRTFLSLRPLDRQLLWLAYAEGASHREIAAALGLRERSIRVLLSRARAKLAELLSPVEDPAKAKPRHPVMETVFQPHREVARVPLPVLSIADE